jgi:hypothetical protein
VATGSGGFPDDNQHALTLAEFQRRAGWGSAELLSETFVIEVVCHVGYSRRPLRLTRDPFVLLGFG